MLKGGVEKCRVVVGRRRALLRLPATLQDGWLVAMVTGHVTQRLLVSAHRERKKPETEEKQSHGNGERQYIQMEA